LGQDPWWVDSGSCILVVALTPSSSEILKWDRESEEEIGLKKGEVGGRSGGEGENTASKLGGGRDGAERGALPAVKEQISAALGWRKQERAWLRQGWEWVDLPGLGAEVESPWDLSC